MYHNLNRLLQYFLFVVYILITFNIPLYSQNAQPIGLMPKSTVSVIAAGILHKILDDEYNLNILCVKYCGSNSSNHGRILVIATPDSISDTEYININEKQSTMAFERLVSEFVNEASSYTKVHFFDIEAKWVPWKIAFTAIDSKIISDGTINSGIKNKLLFEQNTTNVKIESLGKTEVVNVLFSFDSSGVFFTTARENDSITEVNQNGARLLSKYDVNELNELGALLWFPSTWTNEKLKSINYKDKVQDYEFLINELKLHTENEDSTYISGSVKHEKQDKGIPVKMLLSSDSLQIISITATALLENCQGSSLDILRCQIRNETLKTIANIISTKGTNKYKGHCFYPVNKDTEISITFTNKILLRADIKHGNRDGSGLIYLTKWQIETQ